MLRGEAPYLGPADRTRLGAETYALTLVALARSDDVSEANPLRGGAPDPAGF
jgi:hypothetical protein